MLPPESSSVSLRRTNPKKTKTKQQRQKKRRTKCLMSSRSPPPIPAAIMAGGISFFKRFLRLQMEKKKKVPSAHAAAPGPPHPRPPSPLEGELVAHGGDVIQPSLAEVLKCLPAWTAVLSLCLFLMHFWTLIASARSSARSSLRPLLSWLPGSRQAEREWMERDPGWMLVWLWLQQHPYAPFRSLN